jgi:hypothetical protein
MDIRQLHDEEEKMRVRARSLRSDAQRASDSAAGMRGRDDEEGALLEERRAKDLERQADEIDRQADKAALDAADKLKRAQDIERQEEQIKKDAESALDDLERQKRSLTGNSTGLF